MPAISISPDGAAGRSGAVAKRGHDRWFVRFDGPARSCDRQTGAGTAGRCMGRELSRGGTRSAASRRGRRHDAGRYATPATFGRPASSTCGSVRTEKTTVRTDRSAMQPDVRHDPARRGALSETCPERLDWKIDRVRIYDVWARELTPPGAGPLRVDGVEGVGAREADGWITSNPAKEARTPAGAGASTRRAETTPMCGRRSRPREERDFLTVCIRARASDDWLPSRRAARHHSRGSRSDGAGSYDPGGDRRRRAGLGHLLQGDEAKRLA